MTPKSKLLQLLTRIILDTEKVRELVDDMDREKPERNAHVHPVMRGIVNDLAGDKWPPGRAAGWIKSVQEAAAEAEPKAPEFRIDEPGGVCEHCEAVRWPSLTVEGAWKCACAGRVYIPDPRDIVSKAPTPVSQEGKAIGDTVNHEEAFQYAHFKRKTSNLARCYLDLRSQANPTPVAPIILDAHGPQAGDNKIIIDLNANPTPAEDKPQGDEAVNWQEVAMQLARSLDKDQSELRALRLRSQAENRPSAEVVEGLRLILRSYIYTNHGPIGAAKKWMQATLQGQGEGGDGE